MYIPMLYICGEFAGKVGCKGQWKILIRSSASFQTWACPVIKILSKNDSLCALLQLFVAEGCRNASYHQERCFCFPYLSRKEVSLSSFYELIEGLPLSATAAGKSHSHSEVPVVRGSRGCWASLRSHFVSQLTELSQQQHSGAAELCWPSVHDDFSGFYRTFFPDC